MVLPAESRPIMAQWYVPRLDRVSVSEFIDSLATLAPMLEAHNIQKSILKHSVLTFESLQASRKFESGQQMVKSLESFKVLTS